MSEDQDFFASLDAEIAEAQAKASLKKDAARLKTEANNMRLSQHQRKRAAEDFHALQAIIEETLWAPVAVGALFTEQHCDGCDTIHRTFLQYMQQEQKISTPTTKRWRRVAMPENFSLARETIVQPIRTHICAACAPEHGFDVDFPSIRLLPAFGTLTVSSTYIQGDINGPATED